VKVSFINVNDIEYVAQYDKENVFFTRKKENPDAKKMVIIELAYGEVRKARVIQNKEIIHLVVLPSVQYNNNAHDIVRAYAPIIEDVVFP